VEEIGDLLTGIILVESSRTFQGHSKPVIFPTHATRLPPEIRSKIRHVVEVCVCVCVCVCEYNEKDKNKRTTSFAR
jgi:DsbC/DsbD-like thiol-disulfide interchange protein